MLTPINAADRSKNNSKRKVFSKSFSHNFLEKIEIMFGNINQYKDLRRFPKLLNTITPEIRIKIKSTNMKV